MSDYKATPEQWAAAQDWAAVGGAAGSLVLELRARVEKLERGLKDEADCNAACNSNLIHRIKKLEANSSARLTDSNHPVKPDSSLVERVADAINSETGSCFATIEARAAIREVAQWLSKQSPVMHRSGQHWAEMLDQEAEQ